MDIKQEGFPHGLRRMGSTDQDRANGSAGWGWPVANASPSLRNPTSHLYNVDSACHQQKQQPKLLTTTLSIIVDNAKTIIVYTA
ncbi:UNVERIFIED_CONTAM: hypothetical protein ODX46_05820, partial [Salmonella enterica subsp. enterica serovar Enteritidis]